MSNIYINEPPTKGKVLLVTSVGDIDIELWSKEAPKACRNFVQLCMEEYYNGTIFHRVVKDFIVQGGDPTGTGTGGESIYGAPFKDELHSRLRFVRRGLVAMANAGPHDNGSQFFFTMNQTPELQNKHTIFGKVGGDTVYNMLKLQELEVDVSERPVHPHRIIRTEILSNPFEDIIPRAIKKVKKEKEDDKKIKSKSKATKNFSLLSFGEEAEEDEEQTFRASKKFSGKSKSSHDLTDDPDLSSVPVLESSDTGSTSLKRKAQDGVESGSSGVTSEDVRKKLKKEDTPVIVPKLKKEDTPLLLPKPKKEDTPLLLPKPKKEDTPLPLPKLKKEDIPLPLPKPKKEDTPLPLPKPKKEDTPLPLPKPKKEDTPLPLPKPKKEDTPLPLPKPKKEDTPLPLPKLKKQDTPLPLPKPKKEDTPLPLPKPKKEDTLVKLAKLKKEDTPVTLPKQEILEESAPDEVKKSKSEDIKKEVKKLQKEIRDSKKRAHARNKEPALDEKKVEGTEQTVKEEKKDGEPDFLEAFKLERQKYKNLKKQQNKKGMTREDQTLAILEKFQSKLSSVKQLAAEYSDSETEEGNEADDNAEEDARDMSWLRHKLKFEDANKKKVLDANVTDTDRYEIHDPRNPMTQRRREASQRKAKK